MDILKQTLKDLELDVACLMDEGGRIKRRDLHLIQDKLDRAIDLLDTEHRRTVCPFLLADISRLCGAEVVAASSGRDCFSMSAKGWPDLVIVSAHDARIIYPATIDRDQYLMIQGAATCAGYTMIEHWEED